MTDPTFVTSKYLLNPSKTTSYVTLFIEETLAQFETSRNTENSLAILTMFKGDYLQIVSKLSANKNPQVFQSYGNNTPEG